jgi:hypothetical protein
MPRAIVHIGVAKTGTTTFQTWATQNREGIRRATGLRYYRSVFPDRIPAVAQFEFEILCMRPDRECFARNWISTASLVDLPDRVRRNLAQELDGEDLFISDEGLAQLRYPDEVERLQQLLVGYDLEFIAVRRDRADFLRSYRQWMANLSIEPSTDPDSPCYVEPDSWLADFDAIESIFPDLRWVEYEAAMQTYGSIIPALCEEMGLDLDALPNWRIPKQNASRGPRARANKMRRRPNRRKRQFRHRMRQLGHRTRQLLHRS